MSERLLLCRIDGRQVCLPATETHSVVEIDRIVPVPHAPHYITGIAALRSRILTVVDCRKALGLAEATKGTPQAVVLDRDGHLYALQVDAALDVVDPLGEAKPVIGGTGKGWDRVARGMVETTAGPALLIDPDALIAEPRTKAA